MVDQVYDGSGGPSIVYYCFFVQENSGHNL